MQVPEREQYSGNVTGISGEAGIISSITTYHEATFNESLHYHDNAQ